MIRAPPNSRSGSLSLTLFTVVPLGSQTRIGIDRDLDGFYDRDEIESCSDPANTASTPNNVVITGDYNADGRVELADYASLHGCLSGPDDAASLACQCWFDFDGDGTVDLHDMINFMLNFTGP